jgi:hypothetical protein
MLELIKIKNTEVVIKQAVKSGRAVYDTIHNPDNKNGLETALKLGWLDNNIK